MYFQSLEKENTLRKKNNYLSHKNLTHSNDNNNYLSYLHQNIGNQVLQRMLKSKEIQAKLRISQPSDPLEIEADKVAQKVMRMPSANEQEMYLPIKHSYNDKEIDRKCTSCEEEDEELKKFNINRKEKNGQSSHKLHLSYSIEKGINESVDKHGSYLDTSTKEFMESKFGYDFSNVKIHNDSMSNDLTSSVNSRAFTFGNNIFLSKKESIADKKLIAHELTHIIQQNSRTNSLDIETINRKQIGTTVTHPSGSKSKFKQVTANFDGRDFVVFGDKTELIRVSAQSGRPYSVRASDAKLCGGSTNDSYMNNPLYVGISDNGPIPEGDFQFRANEMTTFSSAEQTEMLLGGTFTDPFGRSLHGGDWGAGRVVLNKIRVLPGKKGCGDTAKRSGFFLHGGIMPGSSGCIDIGNSAFNSLVKLLIGYRGSIKVTVKYTHAAPEVGEIERALGRFTYPEGENPNLFDRLGSMLGL